MSDTVPNIDPSLAMVLGEVRGQLREIIHTMNNERAKQEIIAEKLAKLDGVPATLQDIQSRLSKLETERDRRDGANSILATLLKSPALGWLVGAAVAAWAFIEGKTP